MAMWWLHPLGVLCSKGADITLSDGWVFKNMGLTGNKAKQIDSE